MLTNHHCGFSAIQSHSSVEHDYLADGFWAYKMEDELTNPGVTASILERMEDVTDRIAPFLKDDMSEMDRGAIIDSISAVIVKEAVAGTKLSGQVQPMFEGNQFFLFLYTIYKDVRLVGAPPQSMENSVEIPITGCGPVILPTFLCSVFTPLLTVALPNTPKIMYP